MSIPFKPDEKLISFAYETIESPNSPDDVKRGLSVVLAADFMFSTENVAQALMISRATVFRYRQELKDIFSGQQDPRENWGGRRYNILSQEEEQAFFNKWQEVSLKGELIDVKDIHNDLIKTVGRPIALSSTYNLLHRNNWRKLKPDTRHPKGDPAAREEFKKKCQNCWAPLSKRKTH